MKLDPLLLILVAAIVLWPSRAYGRRSVETGSAGKNPEVRVRPETGDRD